MYYIIVTVILRKITDFLTRLKLLNRLLLNDISYTIGRKWVAPIPTAQSVGIPNL